MTEKAAMRQAVRALCPDAAAVAAQSERICAALSAWEKLQNARSIAAYMALPREADLTPLLPDLLRQGKRIALPKITKDGMCFYWVEELTSLAPGVYGVREPGDMLPLALPEDFDVVLVPIEAMDRQGGRLGKGKGYYDRFLAETRCPACGAALAHQLVDRVPLDPWDAPLDYLADQSGVRRTGTR